MAWASKVSLSGEEGSFGTCCLMWSVWNGGISVSFVGVFSCFTQKNERFPILLKNKSKKTQTRKPQRTPIKEKSTEKIGDIWLIWAYINIYDYFGNTKRNILNTNDDWTDHILLKKIKEASRWYLSHLLTFSQNWKGIEWDAQWEVEPC